MSHWQRAPALQRLVAVATMALIVATAATLAARCSWFFDLFSHFRWQYVVGAGVTIPLAWLGGQPRLALACVAVLLVHVQVLAVQRFGSALESRSGARPLRVVSYNVRFDSRNYPSLIRFVGRTVPDIVCLYETTSDWQRNLAPLTARFAFSLFTGEGPRTGIACMSRIAPLRVVPPPVDANAAPWMQLQLESGGTRVTVVGVHFSHPIGPVAADARNRRLADLAAALRAVPGPIILVGDFNLSPYSPHNTDFLAASRLRDCSRGHPLAPTWPTWFAPLWIQIDRCFVSADVGVAHYFVGPALGSDHYPLVMDFLIPTGDIRVSQVPVELWDQPAGQ
jgi:endonuclease/exonuclease/phosphatase (EEP) superfamily protein YafD